MTRGGSSSSHKGKAGLGSRASRSRGETRQTDQKTGGSSSDLSSSEVTSMSDASSSSSQSVSVPSTDLSLVEDLSLGQLSLTGHLPSLGIRNILPPQQRSKKLFPGRANTGRSCSLQTNHFTVKVKVPEGVIHMYEVNIVPPWTRSYRQSDKVLYQEAVRQWKKLCPAVAPEQHCWVFDGYKQLYSTRRHHNQEFSATKVTIWSAEDERMLDMVLQDVSYVMTIKVDQDILEWATKGRSGGIPQESLEALNVVLKQAAVTDLGWTSIGRCFFRPGGRTIDLGFGKETWTGVFSTIRPHGWKDHDVLLTLNVDTLNKPAVKPIHLTHGGYIKEVLANKKYGTVDLAKGLTNLQITALGKDLKDLKVRYEVPDKNGVRKRQYRVNDVRKLEAGKEKIDVDGKLLSIVEYFKKQYNITLKYPKLPCLWVGARDKTTYLPMEFCSLVSQPMPRKKKLPDEAIATMIRQTSVKPLDRQKKIMDELKKNNAVYSKDPYAKAFGISVAGEMTTLTGRILAPPSIEYKDKKSVRIQENNPGKWFMSNNHHYVDGKRVNRWALLDFSLLSEAERQEVVSEFYILGKANGLVFSDPQTVLRVNGGSADVALDRIEKQLSKLKYEKMMELVLIVLPFKASFLYDKIKRLGDIELNLVTQCCLKTNLFRKGEINKQVISNLCLKINSKLGGKNHVLSPVSRPSVLSRPVMIMGADVSHPAPETRGVKPSIAAIVASMEPTATCYQTEVRVQDTSLDSWNEEVINDMKNVTKALMMKFFQATRRKPEKLIMFRDGVSEGQFLTVLSQELVAMREACRELQEDYEPAITFIVVQKRHHTRSVCLSSSVLTDMFRFFPADNNQYKNGNALAGTVIDQGINHPTEVSSRSVVTLTSLFTCRVTSTWSPTRGSRAPPGPATTTSSGMTPTYTPTKLRNSATTSATCTAGVPGNVRFVRVLQCKIVRIFCLLLLTVTLLGLSPTPPRPTTPTWWLTEPGNITTTSPEPEPQTGPGPPRAVPAVSS